DRCSSTALNWLDLPTSLAFAPPKPYTSDLQTQAHPNPPQQKSKASGVKIIQRCGPWYAAGKGAGSLGSSPSSIPTTFPNIVVCGWVEACGDADILQGSRILAGHATGQNGGNDAKRTQKERELSKKTPRNGVIKKKKAEKTKKATETCTRRAKGPATTLMPSSGKSKGVAAR
ncbi:hypothetical protein CSPX01_12752, partial [Colletotrichum filicis]